MYLMSYDFLIQSVKILHNENNSKSDIDFVYDFVMETTDTTLNVYKNRTSIISYTNDFELFIEIINKLITILESEEYEEYEKCLSLVQKRKNILFLIDDVRLI